MPNLKDRILKELEGAPYGSDSTNLWFLLPDSSIEEIDEILEELLVEKLVMRERATGPLADEHPEWVYFLPTSARANLMLVEQVAALTAATESLVEYCDALSDRLAVLEESFVSVDRVTALEEVVDRLMDAMDDRIVELENEVRS